MAVYKVSFVITGTDYPGTIANLDHRPVIGEQLQLGNDSFIVVEVIDLMPARGEFHYIHVTCRPSEPETEA